MSSKPSDFHLGVIELFGILVPGAALALLHGERLLKWLAISQPVVDNDTVALIWFLVGSYLLGHLLLGAGEGLDKVHDAFRRNRDQALFEEMKQEIDLPKERKQDRKEVFNRAFSYVRLNSAAAIGEIEHRAADYKLFRSLTIVILLNLVFALFARELTWTNLSISLLLIGLTFWRYWFLRNWTERLVFEYYILIRSQSCTAASS